MWDPPRPGLKPVSPALAGRFSTTVPPGKPTNNYCLSSSEASYEEGIHRSVLQIRDMRPAPASQWWSNIQSWALWCHPQAPNSMPPDLLVCLESKFSLPMLRVYKYSEDKNDLFFSSVLLRAHSTSLSPDQAPNNGDRLKGASSAVCTDTSRPATRSPPSDSKR